MALALGALLIETAFAADPGNTEEPEVHTLPEIEVKTSRTEGYTILPERDPVARPFTESPGLDVATSVVGRQEIEALQAYSVVDVMNYVPGAWTETRGRKVKQFFSVRGQRYPYPGYVVDGAWFREFHEINYYLSAASLDRIEILRSSGALLMGPGGLTGMINLVPRTHDHRETQVEGLGGTHKTFRSHVSHGNKFVSGNYALSGGYFHTDGAEGLNASENMANLYGRVLWQPSDALTLSWTNFFMSGDRELKLARPPAGRTLQMREDNFDPMQTYVTVAKLRHQPADTGATEVIFNYGGRYFDGHRTGSSDWLEEDYEYGATVIHSREMSAENTLRATGLFHRWATPTGKRFYVGNPGDIRTYSAAVVDEHDFGKVDISIGYRYTREHIGEFGGFNVEGSPGPLRAVAVKDEWSDPLHTVNLGASYKLTSATSLFGNAAWGQLAAQPGMLDYDLRRPGSEERYKLDLGVRWLLQGYGELNLVGFFVRRNDAALVSKQTVRLDGVDYALFSSDNQENYGFELDMRTHWLNNGLKLFFNLTFMQTRRTIAGDWVNDKEVPDLILAGGVAYAIEKYEIGLYAKHLSGYENERFLPGGSSPAPLGDFLDLSGQLTYHYHRNTEFFARVENITADEYSTVPGYPHDGTLFYLGVTKRFN
jgi:outer membrane receptor protein involved in Fe transport